MLLRWLLVLSLMVFAVGKVEAQTADLIINGDMSGSREGRQPIAGWDNWLWAGEGAVERYSVAGQPPAAVIRNQGLAKQAIFQKLDLSPCSYRLTAEVAGSTLLSDGEGRATTIHVELGGGQSSITHNVFRADGADWHKLELVFTVTSKTTALFYFFNYGSGYYFVRNIALRATSGCRGEPPSFDLIPIPGARLGFEPPLAVADFALTGYCDDKTLSRRLFCSTQAPTSVSVRPAADGMLADFESGPGVFTSAVTVSGEAAIAGRNSAQLVKGRYLSTSPSQGLLSDWTGYDWLRIDTFNGSAKPVAVYVEINDGKTTGYWSRVNWTTAAPPGRSTIDVPLRTFVGEKSVTRERRRLDLKTISRLVLTATDGDIKIDNVRLETEPPFQTTFPKLLRFDFGTPTSPVMTGFTQVTADMLYSERRGYGFSRDVRFGKSEDRRHPDDLFRDWTSILSGGFDFDLPNGRYRVWMMLEDPGYWEYYPSATQRGVTVQGREIEAGIRPYSDFARRFWRHANDEDLPGDDIWRRYIEPRYRPLTTTAEVENGKLRLRFDGNGDPHAVTLSALVVFPESQAGQGEAFLAELFSRLRSSFDREYRQVLPPVGESTVKAGNALGGELSVFTRSLALDIAANTRPTAGELVTAFDVQVPRGETVSFVVGLLPGSDLGLVGAELRLPGIETKLSVIRNKISRLTIDGSVYAALPRVLDPLGVTVKNPLPLQAGAARALLVELVAPPNATAGDVSAPFVLSFSNGRRLDLPVRATIKPWALPSADIPIGYLGTATRYPLATYPEIAPRRLAELRAGLSLLKRSGMTAVSGGLGGPRLVRYFTGKPQLDVSRMRPSLQAIAESGYQEVLTYDGLSIEGLPTDHVSDTQAQFNKPYVEVLGDVLSLIERERALAGLREIVHALADEPDEGSIPGILEVARAFKKAQPTAKTAAFTSLADVTSDPRRQLIGNIDHIYLNVHSEAAIDAIVKAGGKCSLYNREGRYARGIYLLKMRDLGCKGHMQFAFNSAHVDHWYDLDGRESDQVAVFTHPDGRLRRSIELLRYRQSVDDYRYLMMVDRLSAGGRTVAKEKASKWLKSLQNSMIVGAPSPFTDAEIDEIRRTAMSHIDAMEAARPVTETKID